MCSSSSVCNVPCRASKPAEARVTIRMSPMRQATRTASGSPPMRIATSIFSSMRPTLSACAQSGKLSQACSGPTLKGESDAGPPVACCSAGRRSTALRRHSMRLALEVLNQRLRLTAIEMLVPRCQSVIRTQQDGNPRQHCPAVCRLGRRCALAN